MMPLKESQTVEFKQIWKDEYLKTITAFSNSDGGDFYIGVCDDGEVVGVDEIKILLEILPNKINNRLGVLVDVLIEMVDAIEIIHIRVSKTYAPVSFNGKFYKRSGSTTIIIDDCLKMGMPEPEYKYTFHSVQVTFYKTTPKTTKQLLIRLMEGNNTITREELADKLGISINGVKQHILNLKKENILERVGGRKDGYWKINVGEEE